jgi:hypothetical protein
MSCAMSVYLGVYALGAADAAERSLVEAHLGGCAACRAELARLEPLPGLLARVPLSLVPGGAGPGRVPGRAAAGRVRRGRATRWRVLAATAAAAAAVGGVAGFWLGRPGAGPAPAITLSGVNRASHVHVMVTLTATSWGTSIELVARGLPENVPCRLIVRSRAGVTEVTGVWNSWSAGPVTIPASAGVRPADIASLRVATTSKNLVTITTRRAAAPGHPAG